MSIANTIREIEALFEAKELESAAARSALAEGGIPFWHLVRSLPKASMLASVEQGLDGDLNPGLRGPEGPQSIESYLEQLKGMDSVSQCPILAVTGMLNAGKSSLVASFLSKENRRRILIGQSNKEGTHRFVLWVPAAWKRSDPLWRMVLQQLKSVFGETPELLAEEWELAARQYNGEVLDVDRNKDELDSMQVPLIATDLRLDEYGLAIMDCPDVQTGWWIQTSFHPSPEEGSELSLRHDLSESESAKLRATHRGRVLSQAMQLCSAFLVVAPANGYRDQLILDLLSTMQARMPSIDRIMVVNRVPRKYAVSEILEDIRTTLTAYELRQIYMAYSFDGPVQRDRLPVTEAALGFEEQNLPIAFRIDEPPTPQPPETIPTARLLVSLGSQVDRGKWMGACRLSLVQQLKSAVVASWGALERENIDRQKRCVRAWQVIADACLSMSLVPDQGTAGKRQLRLHASREIVSQLSSSLERTAPWWAKPSRMVIRTAQSARNAISKTWENVNPKSWLNSAWRDSVDSVKGRFHRGEVGKVVSASTLVQYLKNSDLSGDLGMNSPSLEERCQRVIDRFQTESQTRLDDLQLDQFTAQLWARMGWKQRLWQGLGPAMLAFAPILAVMAIPFDFGGSSVLVLASIKELLLASAVGGFLALSNRDGMPQVAEDEAAMQQLSDLFVIACDQLGLPRPDAARFPRIRIDDTLFPLKPSSIQNEATNRDAIFATPVIFNEKFMERFQSHLKRLQEEISQ